MCAVLGVGPTANVMIIFCIVEGVFYMAQWEEYHTGTLNWSNGYMGVTESQLIQMGLFVVTACFGEECWTFLLFGYEACKNNSGTVYEGMMVRYDVLQTCLSGARLVCFFLCVPSTPFFAAAALDLRPRSVVDRRDGDGAADRGVRECHRPAGDGVGADPARRGDGVLQRPEGVGQPAGAPARGREGPQDGKTDR